MTKQFDIFVICHESIYITYWSENQTFETLSSIYTRFHQIFNGVIGDHIYFISLLLSSDELLYSHYKVLIDTQMTTIEQIDKALYQWSFLLTIHTHSNH